MNFSAEPHDEKNLKQSNFYLTKLAALVLVEKQEACSLGGYKFVGWIGGCSAESCSKYLKSDQKLESPEKLKSKSLEGGKLAGWIGSCSHTHIQTYASLGLHPALSLRLALFGALRLGVLVRSFVATTWYPFTTSPLLLFDFLREEEKNIMIWILGKKGRGKSRFLKYDVVL